VTALDFILIFVVGYVMFLWGKFSEKTKLGQMIVNQAINRAIIPVLVCEEIDGQYYLYEKDTQNFVCQSDSLDALPQKLYNAKKITLALLLFPEKTFNTKYWCINGKIKVAK
jgi:hypothetical protein